MLHSFFHIYRHDHEKIDPVRADIQFRMGKRDPVFPWIHSTLCHCSLSQVSSAHPKNRTILLPDGQVGTQLASVFSVYDFPDYRSVSRFSLYYFFLERVYI